LAATKYTKIYTAGRARITELLMLATVVSGFKLKVQAKIKAKATVECPHWIPWNVFMRVHRRKKDRCLYIDGWYG